VKRFIPITLTLLLAAPVFAAEVRQELDEVVVSASRVSEKVKDTPVAVSILTEQELEKVKARNPEEILSRVPGINSQGFGGESELTAIRVPTHFTNPYTIVLIDGVPTSSYGSGSSSQFLGLNSDSIARIEVIKGPASALYGSNAIGGIINVITKEPTAEAQGKIWIEAGEYSHFRSGLSGSGGSGKMGFNIDLSLVDSDGWRDQSSLEKQAATVKINYTPTDSSILSFKTDLLSSENDSAGSLNEADFKTDWQHSYHTFAYKEADKISPSLSYNLYLDNGEFSSTFTVRDEEEKSIPNYSIRQLTFGPFPRPYVGSLTETETTDMDLQLLYSHNFSLWRGKINTGLDIVRGSKETKSYDLDVTKDTTINKYTSYIIEDLAKSYDIDTDVTAPYVQIELSPIEKIRFSAGGRYDSATYDVDDRLGGGKGGKKKFSRFSPKVGLTYDVNPGLNGYISYSDGFVVPTTSQLWTSRYDNNDLDPEKAKNYEIGIRSLLWQKRIRLDCSLYTMTIDDKIVVDDAGTMYANAGESSQDGAEIMATILPHDKVRLDVAYTYARNKYDSYSTGGIDYSGNMQPRSPRNHLNARVTLLPVSGLEVEFELDDTSSQYADDANLHKYNRPTLFNIRTAYDWENWTLWAHVLNVTDKEYASYVSYSASEDSMTMYSGAPRTFYAGLSFRFGERN
jgi:iron complex outermembrane recepter protein